MSTFEVGRDSDDGKRLRLSAPLVVWKRLWGQRIQTQRRLPQVVVKITLYVTRPHIMDVMIRSQPRTSSSEAL